MPRYVVLLRGVNVGGGNRLPMADLRTALTRAGFVEPRTYVASGNIVVDDPESDPVAVAERVRSVIARTFDLDIPVIAVTGQVWSDIAVDCPFPVDEPKLVHVIAYPEPLTKDDLSELAELQAASDAKGRRDRATGRGAVVYLHTPDGFGTSDLARALSTRRSRPLFRGTARNWSTVQALIELANDSDPLS